MSSVGLGEFLHANNLALFVAKSLEGLKEKLEEDEHDDQ